MQEFFTISFDLGTSDPSAVIAVRVLLDGNCVFETPHVDKLEKVQFMVADDETDHELIVEISGKTIDHTKIDSDGNIIQDVLIQMNNFEVDNIDVNKLFTEKIVYTHNFNGTSNNIETEFFGSAGCNGTLNLKFFTPMYLWLLESM